MIALALSWVKGGIVLAFSEKTALGSRPWRTPDREQTATSATDPLQEKK
jgi:hypothetical protein